MARKNTQKRQETASTFVLGRHVLARVRPPVRAWSMGSLDERDGGAWMLRRLNGLIHSPALSRASDPADGAYNLAEMYTALDRPMAINARLLVEGVEGIDAGVELRSGPQNAYSTQRPLAHESRADYPVYNYGGE